MVPEPVDFCIAQDMIALRVDNAKIYNKYLFAVLRSFQIQQQIYSTSVGDVIPHFKKQFLNQLMIPIPERGIQEIIGDLYYVLSLKIDENERINSEFIIITPSNGGSYTMYTAVGIVLWNKNFKGERL